MAVLVLFLKVFWRYISLEWARCECLLHSYRNGIRWFNSYRNEHYIPIGKEWALLSIGMKKAHFIYKCQHHTKTMQVKYSGPFKTIRNPVRPYIMTTESKTVQSQHYCTRPVKPERASWDWAGPSSAPAGIRLNFDFLHHQNSTCNGWDITKNIIASHGISGRLAGGLAR